MIILGLVYVLGASLYVSIFIFMVPDYAAMAYFQATLVSVTVVEVLKPLVEAVVLEAILKSPFRDRFAAFFPQARWIGSNLVLRM